MEVLSLVAMSDDYVHHIISLAHMFQSYILNSNSSPWVLLMDLLTCPNGSRQVTYRSQERLRIPRYFFSFNRESCKLGSIGRRVY